MGGRLPLSASQSPRDANGHSATAPLSGASKGLLGLIRNSLTRHSRVPSEDRSGAAAAAAAAAASAAGLGDSAASLQKQLASGVRALLESSNLTDASTANGTNLSTMSVVTSGQGGVAGVGLDNSKPGSSSESLPGMLGTRPSGLGVLDLEKIKRLASLDLKFWEPIHAQGKVRGGHLSWRLQHFFFCSIHPLTTWIICPLLVRASSTWGTGARCLQLALPTHCSCLDLHPCPRPFPAFNSTHSFPLQACPLRVRGKKYLEDRRKIPAGMAAFHFAAIDIITTPHVVEHVARFLPSIR